jgi:hypothetical protein
MIRLVESHMQLESTLNPSDTAAANALAMQTRIKTLLGTCGTVTLADATLSVNFGAAPGCTLSNGVQAVGSVAAAVSKVGSIVSVRFDFTTMTINGRDVTGWAKWTRATPSQFQVTGKLGTDPNSANLFLSVMASPPGVEVSGRVERTNTGVLDIVELGTVKYTLGDCYPQAGTLTCSRAGVQNAVSVTCNSNTAKSGVVTVIRSATKESGTATLPAYGSCPKP